MIFLIALVTALIFASTVRADHSPCITQWGIAEVTGFALEVTGGTPYTGDSLNPPIGNQQKFSQAFLR